MDAVFISKTIMKALEHPWTRVFMNIFSTFDIETVRQCQLYTGFKSIDEIIKSRTLTFMNSMKNNPCWFIRRLISYIS